jgi:ATP-dependent RNA helicase SUPV3L1/SUV3
VGHLEGLRFVPAAELGGVRGQALWKAVRRAVEGPLEQRVAALEAAADEALELDATASIRWDGALLGRLLPGPSPLEPRVQVLQHEWIDAAQRARVRRRLEGWCRARVEALLEPLRRPAAGRLGPAGRALVFAVQQGLGTVSIPAVQDALRALGPRELRALAALDLRLGTEHAFLASRFEPSWMRWRGVLWCLHRGIAPLPPFAWAGEPSLRQPQGVGAELATALGYALLDGRLLRVDLLEELACRARAAARGARFAAPDALCQPLGCEPRDLDALIRALGYGWEEAEDGRLRFFGRPGPGRLSVHRRSRVHPRKPGGPP